MIARALAVLAASLLLACPPSRATPVVPPLADLDAAPFVFESEGATPCMRACNRMQAWGCWTIASCPATMAELEAERAIRMADGSPMTCAAVAAAPSLAAAGLTCDGGR